MKRTFIAATIAALGLLCASAYAQQLDMQLSLDRKHIYLGESFNLTAKVTGSRKRLHLDLSQFRNCTIRQLESHDTSRSRIVVVNNRIHRESFVGREYKYAITPLNPGAFTAGPVVLVSNKKTISRDGATIEVTGIEKQSLVNIDILSSRETVLVDEPFTITLSIALKQLPGSAIHLDPLDPRTPPMLEVPWLNLRPIPGLHAPEIKDILQKHLQQRSNKPAFHINDFTLTQRPSLFPIAHASDKARFSLPRSSTKKNGQGFFDYTLSFTYVPREEGSYTFGPVIFKGDVLTTVLPEGRTSTTPVFAVGSAYTVRVIPPTEEGRPESYIGAIGSNLVVNASLDTQTCKVGDPLTLTLSISGGIRLDNLFAPSLGTSKGVLDNFTVYEDSIQTVTEDAVRKYIYTVRPTKAGTYELPPIEVSFYDVNTRTYRTVTTRPVPIRARKTTEVSNRDILATEPEKRDTVILSKEENWVIAPITMNEAGYTSAPMTMNAWHLGMIVVTPMLFLLIFFTSLAIKRAALHRSVRAQRNALRDALALLKKAKRNEDSDAGLIVEAMRKYLADRFTATESSITPTDAVNILTDQGIDEALVNRFVDILERCFNSIYEHAQDRTQDVSDDCLSARDVITDIDAEVSGRNSIP